MPYRSDADGFYKKPRRGALSGVAVGLGLQRLALLFLLLADEAAEGFSGLRGHAGGRPLAQLGGVAGGSCAPRRVPLRSSARRVACLPRAGKGGEHVCDNVHLLDNTCGSDSESV